MPEYGSAASDYLPAFIDQSQLFMKQDEQKHQQALDIANLLLRNQQLELSERRADISEKNAQKRFELGERGLTERTRIANEAADARQKVAETNADARQKVELNREWANYVTNWFAKDHSGKAIDFRMGALALGRDPAEVDKLIDEHWVQPQVQVDQEERAKYKTAMDEWNQNFGQPLAAQIAGVGALGSTINPADVAPPPVAPGPPLTREQIMNAPRLSVETIRKIRADEEKARHWQSMEKTAAQRAENEANRIRNTKEYQENVMSWRTKRDVWMKRVAEIRAEAARRASIAGADRATAYKKFLDWRKDPANDATALRWISSLNREAAPIRSQLSKLLSERLKLDGQYNSARGRINALRPSTVQPGESLTWDAEEKRKAIDKVQNRTEQWRLMQDLGALEGYSQTRSEMDQVITDIQTQLSEIEQDKQMWGAGRSGASGQVTPPKSGTSASTDLPIVTNQAQYDAVQPGAKYRDPKGNVRTKRK